MPLRIPNRTGVVRSLQGYVRDALPELDPTITTRRGFIGGIVKSLGSALHDWYVALQRAAREFFPQTATGDFLVQGWWSDITGLSRNPSAAARGRVAITGTSGTLVPSGLSLSSGSNQYTTDNSVAIVAQSLLAASLTRDGDTAIFETSAPHFLATGMVVTISGADQAAYNGAQTIVVTADNEFTFEVSGSPATPATGTILASGTWGSANITCTVKGSAGNLSDGTTMSFQTPVSGLDSTAIVTFGEIGGGTEIETIEAFRERILEALGTDFGMFSADEIEIVAKQIPGVTRVWVQEATEFGANGVNEGQVRIGFMRDGDANPFPSSQEAEAVKDHILSMILPAHTAPEDVIVFSPTKLSIDFTFSSITPDTASMRLAIEASLRQFFSESVDLGVDIDVDDYRCAIKESFDLERRQALRSFVLTDPSAIIEVEVDELPVLGEVTFT